MLSTSQSDNSGKPSPIKKRSCLKDKQGIVPKRKKFKSDRESPATSESEVESEGDTSSSAYRQKHKSIKKSKKKRRKRRYYYSSSSTSSSSSSSSDSSSESERPKRRVRNLKNKVKKYRKRLLKQKLEVEVPPTIQMLFDNLGGLTTVEREKILQRYTEIVDLTPIPKADSEMTTIMEWERKDVSKIDTLEEAQGLFVSEKQHLGLAADVQLRLRYRDTVQSFAPIIKLREKVMSGVNPDMQDVTEMLDDTIMLGANVLFSINQERRERIFKKDEINKDLKGFEKNPENYALSDAPMWVFGPEFRDKRMTAFTSISD